MVDGVAGVGGGDGVSDRRARLEKCVGDGVAGVGDGVAGVGKRDERVACFTLQELITEGVGIPGGRW